MAFDTVKEYFTGLGRGAAVQEFAASSATVDLAAEAVGVIPARIAKTLAFKSPETCVLLVLAGDAKVDNKKFKDCFGYKAKMLSSEEVLHYTGHAVGGTCPFALATEVPVYLDKSLERFATVFPACGSSNSAIELSCEELFGYAKATAWVDLGKNWQADDAAPEK